MLSGLKGHPNHKQKPLETAEVDQKAAHEILNHLQANCQTQDPRWQEKYDQEKTRTTTRIVKNSWDRRRMLLSLFKQKDKTCSQEKVQMNRKSTVEENNLLEEDNFWAKIYVKHLNFETSSQINQMVKMGLS